MVEAIIEHNASGEEKRTTTTVTDFTLIEESKSDERGRKLDEEHTSDTLYPNLTVWFSEPHVYEGNEVSWNMYHNAKVVKVIT
jgi:uncharacterized protein (DUF608 family)